MPDISILNTKSANFHSVKKAIDLYNKQNIITSDINEINNSKGLIIPGVSSTDTVMQNIKDLNLEKIILDFYSSGKPILCICVGMQILFENSEEGVKPGLGIIEGSVKKIPKLKNKFKVPHMGWNQLELVKESEIFKGISTNTNFYFVHSYFCDPLDEEIIIGKTNYSIQMCAAIQKNNLLAVQFHPEKSGKDGLKIYENFNKMIS
ncbi:MAG: imidazole glycerol phosphate synthase subunit HisH [Dehalococcoidales bacterium]|jgi:imidazole glycerol-phosphate synthase subunit HisH|nr:imidazole glycerol phosphate synthase subunit HisH [Dehalococcoidia bacterium]NCG35561.1 imidazole glycerol phosphate synthase subunit HisH [Dehalococcoidales bacterium]